MLCSPQPLQTDRYQHHAEAEQHEALPVKTGGRLTQIGHEVPARHKADHPHRQVNQKDPVPARHLDQPATQRRSHQRAKQPRNGDERHHPQQLPLVIDPQYRQSSHWHQQRTTNPLKHTGGHQHGERIGGGTGERAERKERDGGQIDTAGAESVCQPAGSRDQQRHRQHVGDDHRLHLQRALSQGLGHAGQGSVENGAIQRLHKETDRRQQGQPLALGICHCVAHCHLHYFCGGAAAVRKRSTQLRVQASCSAALWVNGRPSSRSMRSLPCHISNSCKAACSLS